MVKTAKKKAAKKKAAPKKAAAKPTAKAKAEKPKKSAKTLDELKASHYEKILSLNKRVAESELRMHADARVAKASKKAYDTLVGELTYLIKADPSQRDLPFPEPPADQAQPAVAEWRQRSIGVLGLKDGVNSKLEWARITTLGQLDEFWKSGKRLHDLQGIGEEFAAEVADAYADYGKEHPEIFGEKPVDAPAEEPAKEETTEAPAEPVEA